MLDKIGKFVSLNEKELKTLTGGNDSTFAVLLAVAELVQTQATKYHELKEVFVKHGGDLHVECPECNSPVILEYGNCPFCGEHLMGEKKAPVAKKEEKVAKSKVVVEEKPQKSKVAEKLKNFQNTEEEIEEAFEADDEDEVALPSEEEINDMDRDELLELIKENEFEIKDYKKLNRKELRVAVIKYIDVTYSEAEEEEEVKEEPKNRLGNKVGTKSKKVELVKEDKKVKKPAKVVEEDDDFDDDEEEEKPKAKAKKAEPVKEDKKKAKKGVIEESFLDDEDEDEEDEKPKKSKKVEKELPKDKKKSKKIEEEEELDLDGIDLDDIDDELGVDEDFDFEEDED